MPNLIETRNLTLAEKRGWCDGKAGRPPQNDYAPGTTAYTSYNTYYVKGLRRRQKTGTFKSNAASEGRRAEQEIRDRWGCRTYATAVRCPQCGTKNLRREPKTNICLGCVLKRGADD